MQEDYSSLYYRERRIIFCTGGGGIFAIALAHVISDFFGIEVTDMSALIIALFGMIFGYFITRKYRI